MVRDTCITNCKLNNLTLCLISVFAPALISACVMATSPASAAKKSAVQPVCCGDRGNKDSIRIRR